LEREAIRRANISPEMIDDVILGNVLSGGGNIGGGQRIATIIEHE
jgi:acetyl-CoA acetyltransferase